MSAITSRVLEAVRAIALHDGKFLAPRPDYQGAVGTWTADEWSTLMSLCDGEELPEAYEGLLITVTGKPSIVDPTTFPFLLTHRYRLNERGRELLKKRGLWNGR